MFTGIVETTANLHSLEKLATGGARLTCVVKDKLNLKLGDSVAVNGCCLTLVEQQSSNLLFDLSQETLNRTNLGSQKVNSLLNIERPLRMSDFIGGHIVTGHVDGLAALHSIEENENYWVMWISLKDPKQTKYCVIKGSLCVNGVSLTINEISDSPGQCLIRLDLIPETLKRTNLGNAIVGTLFNIEVDILAKHLEKLTISR